MWGQVLHSPLCPVPGIKYSANVYQAMLVSPPGTVHWLSIKDVYSWQSHWTTSDPTCPLLWKRQRFTKLVSGRETPVPRCPVLPAGAWFPILRRLVWPTAAQLFGIFQPPVPRQNGWYWPPQFLFFPLASPPHACPPTLCSFSPVLWPVALIFPGKSLALHKDNQRSLSSSGSGSNQPQGQVKSLNPRVPHWVLLVTPDVGRSSSTPARFTLPTLGFILFGAPRVRRRIPLTLGVNEGQVSALNCKLIPRCLTKGVTPTHASARSRLPAVAFGWQVIFWHCRPDDKW